MLEAHGETSATGDQSGDRTAIDQALHRGVGTPRMGGRARLPCIVETVVFAHVRLIKEGPTVLFRLSWTYMRRNVAPLTIALVFQVAQTLIGLVLPKLNAKIIDHGIIGTNTHYILHMGGLMLAAATAQIVLAAISALWSAKVCMGLGRYLRERMFHHVQAFSHTELQRFGPSSLITRTTNDITQIYMVLLLIFTMILSAPILGIGSLVMVLTMDLPLALVLVVAIPCVIFVAVIIMKKLVPLFELNQKRIDRLGEVLREQLSGVRVIRAFVRQKSEAERFDKANRDLMSIVLTEGFWFAVLAPLIQTIMALAMGSVLYFGGYRIQAGALQLGDLIAFLSYLTNVLMAIILASMFLILIPHAEVSARRVQEVFDVHPAVLTPERPRMIPEGALGLRFDSVTAGYEGASRPVLEDISLVIPPGTTTAIVGATGSGKSSLANLIPRLADPTEGQVALTTPDGEVLGLRDVALADIRRRVALVPQKAYLMRGTVATNVSRLPEDQISEQVTDRVRECLAAAQALEFVDAFDDGIDHAVEAGGANLSGGQRQRLTIARALYSTPDILVSDDAFSALDFATEAQVRAAIPRMLPGVTQVLVVQRLATVRHAENIVVIDNGRIVGQGDHAHLMATCATYQELASTQLTEEELR